MFTFLVHIFFLNYIKSEFFIPAHVLKGNGADERGRPEQQQQQYQLAEQHISANVDLNASWKHRPPSQIPTTIKMKKHKNFWEISFFIQVIEPFYYRSILWNIFVIKLICCKMYFCEVIPRNNMILLYRIRIKNK